MKKTVYLTSEVMMDTTDWSQEDKNLYDELHTAVKTGLFYCTESTPYNPEKVPAGSMVAHHQVEHLETGDVVCVGCKFILSGPNQNV